MNEPYFSLKPAFLETKPYQLFADFCDDCRRYHYIGLCYGSAGVGKTWSARHYALWDIIEPIPLTGTLATELPPPPPEIGGCRTVLYTPSQTASPRIIEEDIERLSTKLKYAVIDAKNAQQSAAEVQRSSPVSYTELLLVDEADRLKMQGLEQLRDIYDRSQLGNRTPMGLILIGMPGIEKRLARYAQLYSRVGFVHRFNALTRTQMLEVLEHNWTSRGLTFNPSNTNVQATIAAIINTTGGNFRLTARLFDQIERIMRINNLNEIDKDVVEAAREMLVIGSS